METELVQCNMHTQHYVLSCDFVHKYVQHILCNTCAKRKSVSNGKMFTSRDTFSYKLVLLDFQINRI